ncbi:MAG: J domain-containing protein [Planctomycetota bacterium]
MTRWTPWTQELKLLGLRPPVEKRDVVDAFRRLSKTTHPDLFARSEREQQQRAQRRFIELKRAYETLLRACRD